MSESEGKQAEKSSENTSANVGAGKIEEKKKVHLRIALNDESILEITDPAVLPHAYLLMELSKLYRGQAPVEMKQFEARSIRFIINNVVALAEDLSKGEFAKSASFTSCDDMSPLEIIRIMEAASFLDCPPIMEGLATIFGHRFKNITESEMGELLGRCSDMTEEDMRDITGMITFEKEKTAVEDEESAGDEEDEQGEPAEIQDGDQNNLED